MRNAPLIPARVNLTLDLVLALLFGAFGLWATTARLLPRATWLALVIMIAALVCRRLAPSVALALAWLSAMAQIATGQDISFLQIGTVIVLYSAVAHGRKWLMVAAGVSVVVGTLVAVVYLAPSYSWAWNVIPADTGSLRRRVAVLLIVPGSVLGGAWLAGLASRLLRQRQAITDARLAAEEESRRLAALAALANDKAELARNVHDVIGHSLAVIIAQSDSVQYIDASDDAAMRKAASAIADTARRSLGEVRQVLSDIEAVDTGQVSLRHDLDGLIENVTRAGARISSTVAGEPVRLDALRLETAHRVLQEGLTNALKFSDRDTDIRVSRRWTTDALQIEVRNAVPAGGAPTIGDHSGSGLIGMKQRLERVGGQLQYGVTEEGRFILAARVPVAGA